MANSNYKTKYPIILVHGMMIKDLFFNHAFSAIKKALQKQGYKVFVAKLDGVGIIETNAELLKKQILNILAKEGVNKINIIAHSKGGLDSRYMVSKLNMEDYVASLTTLSTPHYGSKMSSKILEMPKFFACLINFFVNLFYKILGDKKPNLITVGKQLRHTEMAEFNNNVPNSPKVFYQSYSSKISEKQFCMKMPYKFSKQCENEETDGIVSLSSSKWGEYCGDMGNNANHLQMVGVYYGGKQMKNKILDFYCLLATELSNKGF